MLLSYVLPVEAGNRVPYAELVNTMIGTKGVGWASGYTYPGATCPFGMVQLSPDTHLAGWDWCSGYHYTDSSIIGFSQFRTFGFATSDI